MAGRKKTLRQHPRTRLTSRSPRAVEDIEVETTEELTAQFDSSPTLAPDERRGQFTPSVALAKNFLDAAIRYPPTLAPPESPDASLVEEASIQTVIAETLNSALYLEARRMAAAGKSVLIVADASGRFADMIASDLIRRLAIRPYDAPHFLNALHHELLDHIANAPMAFNWGLLSKAALEIVLVVEPAPDRSLRTAALSKFHRNLETV